MSRVERVRVLAWSLYDLYPAPETSTGKMLRRSVLRGLSPNSKVPCPDCGGDGFTVDKFKRSQVCALCAGKGRVAVDAYDREQKPIGTQETSTVTRTRSNPCDRCGGSGVYKHARCDTCDGSGRREYSPFELHVTEAKDGVVDVLEAAIERRDQSGSYHELERCIAGIAKHVNKPQPFNRLIGDEGRLARDLYTRVWVGSSEDNIPLPELPPLHRELAELAERYVVWAMPPEIRVPAGVVFAWEHRFDANRQRPRANGSRFESRDEIILARRELGESVPSLAAEYGLTDDGLKKALRRARDERERRRRMERRTA